MPFKRIIVKSFLNEAKAAKKAKKGKKGKKTKKIMEIKKADIKNYTNWIAMF